jgi:hypothetical protein
MIAIPVFRLADVDDAVRVVGRCRFGPAEIFEELRPMWAERRFDVCTFGNEEELSEERAESGA